jgi:hypothetical protein
MNKSLAHDRALYAFEGNSNVHLHPETDEEYDARYGDQC